MKVKPQTKIKCLQIIVLIIDLYIEYIRNSYAMTGNQGETHSYNIGKYLSSHFNKENRTL